MKSPFKGIPASMQFLILAIPFTWICLQAPIFFKNAGSAADAVAGINGKPPVLELKVDTRNFARAFCNGMQPIVSIAGHFEFYEQVLTGTRKRIFEGPWRGQLKENFNGSYTLTGTDSASGADYIIVIKQVDSSALEILMTYRAPSKPSHLGFDILKLNADLFKGSEIAATPSALMDSGHIPVEPSPAARRMLLTKKNRVLVRSALCDLEIIDLTESRSLLVADTRNVPWDSYKSITFCAEKNNLAPGNRYSFRYSIRCLPATRTANQQGFKAYGNAVSTADVWPFYSPPPKEETKATGEFQLKAEDTISGLPSGSAETILLRELRNLTDIQLSPVIPQKEGIDRGIHIERADKANLPPEGFEIVATTEKVVIRGRDDRACLFGAYALLGKLKYRSGHWCVDCGKIRDWPDLPVRGVCIELLKPAVRDVALFKRYLDAFSRARSNVVVFLHIPRQIRSWQKSVDDGGWTREQMTEIARYARFLHMDVWGGMGSDFRRTDFGDMEISNGTNFYDPFKDSNYDRLFSMYDEILHAYRPGTLLISHDEIRGMSVYAAQSGRDTGDILAGDVRRIHDWLAQRGVKTAMWGDMLLDHSRWDSEVGSANSNNPVMKSGSTHKAIDRLPLDILILDWHYRERQRYPSIDYFRKHGFTVIGIPWHDPKAAVSLAKSAKTFSGQGVIVSDWGFLATVSPAATTIYAPLCAWSTMCGNQGGDLDVSVLAETMRDPIHAEHFNHEPVSLAAASNRSTLAATRNSGPFDAGPVLDLCAFPTGRHVLGGILFDVASANQGQSNNVVVVAKSSTGKEGLPENKELFQGNISAKSIAFLHTSLIEEPQYQPRTMGRYVVEYIDGRKERIDLLENWNITDVRSSEGLRRNDWSFSRNPDELLGSIPAWRGTSASGISLNLQVFIWKNPHPDLKIRSIRLSATNAAPNTKIVLMGLTYLR